jgi:hypothetical protein
MKFTAGKVGGTNLCAIPEVERKNTKRPPAQLRANFSSSTPGTGRGRWKRPDLSAYLAACSKKTKCHMLLLTCWINGENLALHHWVR